MNPEQRLEGGFLTDEVVQVGGTVRRTAGSHSTFTAGILNYLHDAGFAAAPQYLGRDEQERDILEFIPGNISERGNTIGRNENSYAVAATLLRTMHDLTAGCALAGCEECVIHGDIGPFNTIFRDEVPVAFIDWDFCRPGQRLSDVGYMAWQWCLLIGDTVEDEARRLSSLNAAYGLLTAEQLLDAMLKTQEKNIAYTLQRLNLASNTQARESAEDALDWARRCREHT